MNCVVCGRRKDVFEVVCPNCNSYPTERVIFRGDGYYLKRMRRKSACEIVITDTRLVVVDDFVSNAIDIGNLVGGFTGSLIGLGVGRLAKRRPKKFYFDVNLLLITEITDRWASTMRRYHVCTIKLIDGMSYRLRTDIMSDFPKRIKRAAPPSAIKTM